MAFVLGAGSSATQWGEVAIARDCHKPRSAGLVRDHGRRGVEMLREKSADFRSNCPELSVIESVD
jgi:hypothetical protein